MANPEKDFAVPPTVAGHPAWARLEGQRSYYSGKAGLYQDQYKRIKLTLIGLSAGIPLIVFLPGDGAKYVVALAGVAIAVLEGLLLLNQYGPLWIKYRSTAEGLNRERWLLLSKAGDYADKDADAAMRQLAERVENLLEAERKDWTAAQSQALAQLANTQGFVQAQQDEVNRRALAAGVVGLPAAVAVAPVNAPLPAAAATTPATAPAVAVDAPPAADGAPPVAEPPAADPRP